MTNGGGVSLRIFAIGILLLTVVIRLPSLIHPHAIDDEAVYSLVGNAIADGGRPYVDAIERKPPLLFWTYAAVFKVGGKYNWPFLHTVALLWITATMAGLYLIGRRLFDPLTGLFAALLYSLYQPWAVFIDLAFNGEAVMNLPIVWAWVIALSGSRSRFRPELLLSGMLLCAAFLMKQPAAIAAVPLGIYFLLPAYQRSRGLTFSTGVLQAAVLTVGFFGSLGLTALLLWKQGILKDAFYWILTNHDMPHIFWTKAVLHTLSFTGACSALLIGTAISWRDRETFWASRSAELTALCGLVIASAIGAAAGARFYPHYYIQLIPPLAILAAPCFARIFSSPTYRPLLGYLRPSTVAAWLLFTFVEFSIAQWIGEVARRPPSEAGAYIYAHSLPTDRIFVWGQDPQVYLDAQRPPASRFVVTFPLTGFIFGGMYYTDTRKRIVPGSWEKLDEDFKTHPPVYIVDVQKDPKNAQYTIWQFPVLTRWMENYEPVVQVQEGTIYRAKGVARAASPPD